MDNSLNKKGSSGTAKTGHESQASRESKQNTPSYLSTLALVTCLCNSVTLYFKESASGPRSRTQNLVDTSLTIIQQLTALTFFSRQRPFNVDESGQLLRNQLQREGGVIWKIFNKRVFLVGVISHRQNLHPHAAQRITPVGFSTAWGRSCKARAWGMEQK